ERQRSRVCRGVASGGLLQGDLLAGETFEFADQLTFTALWGETVVVVGTEIFEAGAGIGQQVVGDGEDGVTDRDQSPFLATSFGDATVAGSQEGLGPGGTDRRLTKSAAEPGVAFAG